ncbi:PAS domain-containing sensor histidine kinase [Leptospira langatensis]|uniref:histidine kinase n=1 Tax=Leptospira langatensis TaxID=2484983 RepID=A0A5F1ZXK5_9LEPT|nr:PAS domain-containing sensor histidine kinase [Leptospira langatensis]TGJ98503.1 PAS domain-containing sensor histidine kinase [Leptospira langatensis]TGL43418.1 PAS domain-containing sensor histidine kinase [Leptospira langatensis]
MNQESNLLLPDSGTRSYESLFEYQPLAAFLVEADGTISLVNHRFELISGKKKEEIQNRMKWTQFAHPDDIESLMDAFLNNFQQQGKPHLFTARTRLFTGSGYRKVFIRANRIPTANETILVQLQELDEEGLLRDYSLEDSDYRWRSFLMEGLDIVVILDLAGNILFLNKTFTGASAEEIQGKNLFHILKRTDALKLQGFISKVLVSGKAESMEEWSSFTGKRSHYYVRISPVTKQGDISAILLTVSDTTKQKESDSDRLRRMESQRHRQKLEALGTLAAGVAHEINNPLTGILNYAELVKGQVEENETLLRNMEVIIRESERISGIVRSLLGFAHKEEGIKAHVSTGEIMYSSIQLLLPFLIKDGITVEGAEALIDAEANLEIPLVIGEPQKLKQVFLNLITNARDSLNDKYPFPSEKKKIRVEQRQLFRNELRYVEVTVKDYGIGIREENINRIFDPFFTTKPTTVGTGLGLSVSYDIVREMNGDMEVESEEEEYAIFRVILPAAEKIS